jgi:hypothetical protein
LIPGADIKVVFEVGDGGTANKIESDPIIKNSSGPTSLVITVTYEAITANNNTKTSLYITDESVPGTIIGTKTSTYAVTSPLILGNSRVTINKNQTALDASLKAFMFFSSVLSDTTHTALSTYLKSQNSDSTGILSTLNNSATTQLQTIKDLISTNTATQGTLQEQLNKCKASIPPIVKAFGHKIKLVEIGSSSVSSEDLRACSVLEVRDRLTAAVAATTGTAAAAAAAAARWRITVPP